MQIMQSACAVGRVIVIVAGRSAIWTWNSRRLGHVTPCSHGYVTHAVCKQCMNDEMRLTVIALDTDQYAWLHFCVPIYHLSIAVNLFKSCLIWRMGLCCRMKWIRALTRHDPETGCSEFHFFFNVVPSYVDDTSNWPWPVQSTSLPDYQQLYHSTLYGSSYQRRYVERK